MEYDTPPLAMSISRYVIWSKGREVRRTQIWYFKLQSQPEVCSSNLMKSAANYIAYCLSGLDRRSVDVHLTAFLSVAKEMQCVLPNIFSPIAISWTFKKPAFFPPCVPMCFVQFSQQIAIISLKRSVLSVRKDLK